MKLLFYSHFFAPSVGGVETIVRSLAEGLAELKDEHGGRQFEVTVVTQTPTDAGDDENFSFHVIRRPRTVRLRGLIRDCNVVHVAGPAILPMALSVLTGKPFVVEHHGYQAICPNGLLLHQPDAAICPGHFQARHYAECLRCEKAATGRSGIRSLFLTALRNRLVRRAKANITVSGHVGARVALPHSKMIYHGIEASTGMAETEAPEPICFAFVGRFVPEKGIPVLIEASARVRKERPNFAVKLIGDGPERSKLEKLIAHHNLQDTVAITGFLTGPALQDALRDVSVVIMPSTWEETAGLSAMEQMVRCRVVIAARVGGLAEILGNTGMTFEVGNTQELSQRMIEVLNQPSLIASYGRKAGARARQLFERSRMVAEHASLYSQLLA